MGDSPVLQRAQPCVSTCPTGLPGSLSSSCSPFFLCSSHQSPSSPAEAGPGPPTTWLVCSEDIGCQHGTPKPRGLNQVFPHNNDINYAFNTFYWVFFFSLRATSVRTISKRFTVFFRNYRYTDCALIKIVAEQSARVSLPAKGSCWQQPLIQTEVLNQDLGGGKLRQIICLSRHRPAESHPGCLEVGRGCVQRCSETPPPKPPHLTFVSRVCG